MQRRQFLKPPPPTVPFLGTAGTALCPARLQAPRLLVVFLRGAYDAANIVVPVSSDFYYAARPNLAIPEERSAAADQRLGPASGAEGFHLSALGRRTRSPSCRSPAPTILSRSHFETQDTIELGQPVGGSRDYRSGFMSRIAAHAGGHRPHRLHQHFAAVASGAPAHPQYRAQFHRQAGVAGKNADLIQAMYQGQDLAPAVARRLQGAGPSLSGDQRRDAGRQPQRRQPQGL